MKTSSHTEKKKVACYHCDYKTKLSYNFTKNKWSRKFKCPKCGSGSFQWYNF